MKRLSQRFVYKQNLVCLHICHADVGIHPVKNLIQYILLQALLFRLPVSPFPLFILSSPAVLYLFYIIHDFLRKEKVSVSVTSLKIISNYLT